MNSTIRLHRSANAALLIAGVLVGIAVRLPFLNMLSHDIIGHLGQWYDYIVLNGGVYALADRFADYTPAYLYLLTAAAYLREYVLPVITKVAAIKLPSVTADFLMALAAYKIARIYARDSLKPALAFALVLLLPTVVINSSVWGQADAIYTAAVLWCVYFLAARKPALGMALFGVALALKAQAFFIAPVVLFLLLRRNLRIARLLIAPAVYVLAMLPAILIGRPPLEALGAYFVQAGEFHQLSLGAPNFYLFAPLDFYQRGLQAGLIIAVIAGLMVAIAFALRRKQPDADDVLACAMVSAMLMPFVLPLMHERYFFVADVLSVLAALRWRRLFWLPIAYQFISLSAYGTVLQALLWWNQVLPDVRTFTWVNAAVIVTATIGLILARNPDPPQARRDAGLALGGGLAAILAVGVAAWLIPGAARAPVWVSSPSSLLQPASAASITYGDALELVGYYLPKPRTYRTGIMMISLFFKPLRPLTEEYRLRLDAFALDGRSLELYNEGAADEAPLSTWQPGQIYEQTRYMTIWPTVDAPLLATFKVSWFDPLTGQALAARCGSGECDSKVGVIPIALDYAAVSPWLHAQPQASLGEGRELALLNAAFDPEVKAGQTAVFTTTWRMEAHAIDDLTFFVHVVSADGRLVAQLDAQPHGGAYPTHVWHRGEVVINESAVPLPVDLPAGKYTAVLGAYRSDNQQGVPAFRVSPQDARLPGDVIPLGQLEVNR
ncbi:MAG: glycosyltransferase 87 family protein [Chloroflexi bacterium]|nr:glycosyltransferase 87 family protein [Chloroflexota bacterium]